MNMSNYSASGYLMTLTNWKGALYTAYSSSGYYLPTNQGVFGSWSGANASPRLVVAAANQRPVQLLMYLLDSAGRIYATSSSDGTSWIQPSDPASALFGSQWWGVPSTPTVIFNGTQYLM